MIDGCKICGVSDLTTLNFIVNHQHAPQFVGFICNYEKSKRFVHIDKLKELTSINKRNTQFVAVLVKPDEKILEEIKDLNFDYYQLYDCTPLEIKNIIKKYDKKIITAFTIQSAEDINQYRLYENVTDIYLFDSKGYEKSMSFKHSLIENIKVKKKIMLAGNIQINDDLERYGKIADIIDISGGLETSGLKDISKIEIFLDKVKNFKNET